MEKKLTTRDLHYLMERQDDTFRITDAGWTWSLTVNKKTYDSGVTVPAAEVPETKSGNPNWDWAYDLSNPHYQKALENLVTQVNE